MEYAEKYGSHLDTDTQLEFDTQPCKSCCTRCYTTTEHMLACIMMQISGNSVCTRRKTHMRKWMRVFANILQTIREHASKSKRPAPILVSMAPKSNSSFIPARLSEILNISLRDDYRRRLRWRNTKTEPPHHMLQKLLKMFHHAWIQK